MILDFIAKVVLRSNLEYTRKSIPAETDKKIRSSW